MPADSQKQNLYWPLFKSTFTISAFTFGGGFVIIPLMKAKFVDEFQWLNDNEALDLIAIAQSAPGAVAINAAVILGYKIAGLRGSLTALAATIMPPLLIITLVAYSYGFIAENQYVQFLLQGLQCGATAIIIDVALNLLGKQWRQKLPLPLLIVAGSFAATVIWQVNILYLIITNALIGLTLMQHPKYS